MIFQRSWAKTAGTQALGLHQLWVQLLNCCLMLWGLLLVTWPLGLSFFILRFLPCKMKAKTTWDMSGASRATWHMLRMEDMPVLSFYRLNISCQFKSPLHFWRPCLPKNELVHLLSHCGLISDSIVFKNQWFCRTRTPVSSWAQESGRQGKFPWNLFFFLSFLLKNRVYFMNLCVLLAQGPC